jgi:uncharacterized protein YrzB (UPF0473 family)
MEKDNKLVYIDEKGNEILCEILFTFDSEEFKKSYVLFYPVGEENEDEVEVMAASYTPLEDGSVGELNEIETDEEWNLIEDTLDSFTDDECDCDECDDDCCCGEEEEE